MFRKDYDDNFFSDLLNAAGVRPVSVLKNLMKLDTSLKPIRSDMAFIGSSPS